MPTISSTGKRPRRYHFQMRAKFTLLERLFLEYYSARLNRDQSDALRTILRTYVKHDKSFVADEFIEMAEKVFIPREEDKEVKAELKRQLAEFAKGL